MASIEILQGPLEVLPRWLRVKTAVGYAGISRARLFMLMAEGKIPSVKVTSRGRARGIRLIDRLELDRYLEGLSRQEASAK
jgi:hypothetical protein